VSGVGATLIPNDDVMLLGEQINELAFGFVAPLQSNHASRGHRIPQYKRQNAEGGRPVLIIEYVQTCY
jgi:hypothetical protein